MVTARQPLKYDAVSAPAGLIFWFTWKKLVGSGSTPTIKETAPTITVAATGVNGVMVSLAWLVGASLGAGVAVDFALAYPELVQGLVLLSPVVGGFQPAGEVKQFGE